MIVWKGRLPGWYSLGCPGARVKPAPRLWSRMPVSPPAIAEPKGANRELMKEAALPSPSTTARYTVSDPSPAGAGGQLAGSDDRRRAPGVDQPTSVPGVTLVQKLAQRHAAGGAQGKAVRVADVGVEVGVRQLLRLDQEVGVLRACRVHGTQVEVLEQVEQEQDAQPLAVRRQLRHLAAAVPGADGLDPGRRVAFEVLELEGSARVAGVPDDLFRDRSAVEGVAAVAGDAAAASAPERGTGTRRLVRAVRRRIR